MADFNINPESFYMNFSEPEVDDQDYCTHCGEHYKYCECSYCPICQRGDNKKNIRICEECQEIFNN